MTRVGNKVFARTFTADSGPMEKQRWVSSIGLCQRPRCLRRKGHPLLIQTGRSSPGHHLRQGRSSRLRASVNVPAHWPIIRLPHPLLKCCAEAGIAVDVKNEDAVGHFNELADGAALHAKYDVIWLASFENFLQILRPRGGAGREASRQNRHLVSFRPAAKGAYHGGQARQALIELTSLADMLPVTIQNRNDLVYGEHTLDDNLQSEAGFKDIRAAQAESLDSLPLLQHYGLRAFHEVSPQAGQPNPLDPGKFGQGRTVSFTGFTPAYGLKEDYLLGRQLIRDPANRAYFQTFIGLVALATGQETAQPPASLLDATERPLFQTLKEQPATHIDARLEPSATVKSQSGDGRQVRSRMARPTLTCPIACRVGFQISCTLSDGVR